MEFKYWRPFILFLAKTSMEDGQYVPQDGMIHLVHQLMKRGQGLSLFAGVIEGNFEVRVAYFLAYSTRARYALASESY
jgi:hypothetical protein